VLASAEDEKTVKCDATVSPKKESPSETGEFEADPNYLLCDDSY
jgi:hypothetical protein